MIKVLVLTFLVGLASSTKEKSRETLLLAACQRNPKLALCNEMDEKLVLPPPLPDTAHDRKDSPETAKAKSSKTLKLSPEEIEILQKRCLKVAPLVEKHCNRGKVTAKNAGRCAAYFRDCSQFIPKGDPLGAIANSFSSAVNVNIANVDVKGIPYYPINEEGAVGVGLGLGIPFGAWGGGFDQSVGVRDYWHSDQSAGANWYDGQYGYKNHWNVPLVQSLGIEGGQHNTVSFPLHGPDAGKLKVDNGYGVGPYYQQNDHVGVDWKGGNVGHQFGVGVPFTGVGVMTGQAVAFPSLDTFMNAG